MRFSELQEKAPPGMEQWIKDRKPEFKKRYGDRWQEVLYATAWKQKNNESVEEAITPDHKKAIKGMHQLSGDQYVGLYKTMKDIAGHDGKKQTAPNGKSDSEVSDQPFAYAYTDAEEKMIKGVDPKAKKITSSKSQEPDNK